MLDLHGWGELQGELNRLSKAGDWARMGELIDDEMLAAFAVVARPEEVGAALAQRYGNIIARASRWRYRIAAIPTAGAL